MKFYQLKSVVIYASLFVLFGLSALAQGWEELASLEGAGSLRVMAAANGKIYVLSGQNGKNITTYEYNPETNTWVDKAPIPEGCFWSTAVEYNDKIYVMGGGQAYPGTSYNQIYDPVNDEWSTGDSLITPRMYHSAAVANRKIYLIGGQNGDGTSEWYFEEYDPANDTWASKGNILHNQAWYCGAVGVEDKVYRIAGGRWNAPTDHFDVYDTETETWEELGSFPITLHAPAAVNFQGKIYVMGGTNNGEKIDSIYTYSPTSGNWVLSIVKLPMPMSYHRAAVMGNYIYVFFSPDDDPDGHLYRYKFGNTAVADNEEVDEEISVYPNPSDGSFKLSCPAFSGKFNLKISDVLGRVVYEAEDIIPSGDGEMTVSLPEQETGVYYLRVYYNNRLSVKTIVID